MKTLIRLAFILVALVNLAPVFGVLSAARLEAAYGIEIAGPNLEILLRHRAVLFGIVAMLLLVAAFKRSLRPLASALGLLSMLSFVVIAVFIGGYGQEIARIVLVDIVASVVLLGAWIASQIERAA